MSHCGGDSNGLFGFYRGEVIKHLKNGKCKVFIPGIYPEDFKKLPDNLPDAEQASPIFGGGTDKNGTFSYPMIGAIVWCFFQNGDQNLPVYFAQTYTTDKDTSGFDSVQVNVSDDGTDEGNTQITGTDAQNHSVRCGKCVVYFAESGQLTVLAVPDPDSYEGNKKDEEDKSGEESGEESEEEDTDQDGLYSNGARILMDSQGSIHIESGKTLTLKAPVISIESDVLDVTANETASVITSGYRRRAATVTDEADVSYSLETRAARIKANESLTAESDSILMDASSGNGGFKAKGPMFLPLIAF